MLFRLVSIALAAISFTTFQSSAEIINWATDSSKLPYVIGDIIIFEGANYVASATGSESPSVKPSNFVDIAEELEEVSKSLPPDPPTWDEDELARVQTEAAALTAPDSNSSQSNGLISLSVRGEVGTFNNIRIMGFYLSGSQSGEVLMRGLGPVLEEYGLSSQNLLKDPRISLFKYKNKSNIDGGSDFKSSNDNHSNKADVLSAIKLAVPEVDTTSKQAGLLSTLDSGFYTLHMDDASVPQGTGIGNAAVDLVSGSDISFTHLSSRGIASTQSEKIIIGGFQINGTSQRKIYIRGRGPSLSEYVDSFISDPKLKLYKYKSNPTDIAVLDINNSDLRAENDDVNASTTELITSLPQSDHRWGLLEQKEAALIIDLDPGYYSVHLECADVDSGKNAWLGIDDITD